MNHRSKIAVVGGSGFVGRHLSVALEKQGYEVLVLDIAPCPPNVLRPHISYRCLDMTEDDALLKIFLEFKPDICVDIAGWGMSGSDMLNPKCLKVNVGGTEKLLHACKMASVSKLIYTSTYNVVFCGRTIENGDESYPYVDVKHHLDQYSKSKTIAEQLVMAANGSLLENKGRLITSCIRPAAIYGENEMRHLPRIMMHLDMGMFMFRIGTAKVDWVHVDNLTHAYVQLVKKLLQVKSADEKPAGRPYFISDGSPVDNFEFLKPLVLARGRKFPTIILPVSFMFLVSKMFETIFYVSKSLGCTIEPPLISAEIAKVGITHYFSMKNAKDDFGYVPLFNSDVGAERLAKYYQHHKDSFYFEFVELYWWVAILTGLIQLAMVAFMPAHEVVAYPMMSHVKELGYYLFGSQHNLQLLFYGAVMLHFLEALFATIIASQYFPRTAHLWFLQTLLLGYPSTMKVLTRSARKY